MSPTLKMSLRSRLPLFFRFSVWSVALALLVILSVSLFYIKHPKVLYGDSGLMYLQAVQIQQSNFQNFTFQYHAEDLDPDYNLLPYQAPFLVQARQKYYIDFPPYFALLVALFLELFGLIGAYIPGYLALLVNLLFLYRLFRTLDLDQVWSGMGIVSYLGGTTIFMYNLVVHEYPIALMCNTLSLYYLVRVAVKEYNSLDAMLFGFWGAISLWFRLELGIVNLVAGLSYLLFIRKQVFRFTIYSLAAWLPLVSVLLLCNFWIHGHPLGLRYLVTSQIDSRAHIIYSLFLDHQRGLLVQSPIFLMILALLFIKKVTRIKFLLFIFVFIMLLAALIAPNHGDHLSPRYLFGAYVPGICLILVTLQRLLQKSGTNKILVLGMLAATMTLSLKAAWKNYKWMLEVDRQGYQIQRLIEQNTHQCLILTDYGTALNLPAIYNDYVMVVVSNYWQDSQAQPGISRLEDTFRRFKKAGYKSCTVIRPGNDTRPIQLHDFQLPSSSVQIPPVMNLQKVEL